MAFGPSQSAEPDFSKPGAEGILPKFTGKDFHESLSGADARGEFDTTGVFTVSYGEYVESCEGIDYEPIVRRAERIARESGEIVRREWFCATSPNIAVVHVYVRHEP